MLRRPPRSTLSSSSAASDVYKRQELEHRHKKLAFRFEAAGEHQSQDSVAFDNFSFRYSTDGPDVLRDLVLQVGAKSKVAVLGPNGSGKSTLLKLIVGELPEGSGVADHAVSGRMQTTGRLRVAYVSQLHQSELEPHFQQTACEYLLARVGDMCTRSDARRMLGKLGLTGTVAEQCIGTLSGGERVRLLFACMLVERPHLLVLDEPTNHLDADSIKALSDALVDFGGAVVCVSHHREFVASFANEIWVMDAGLVKVHHAADRSDVETVVEEYAEELSRGCRRVL
eukprot:TRINITY_DN8598_c0_g1_i2.p1 TRINITY_DN8598_c0_g1~~TRINITY_DN8598_c0_g1_i2.p1  ORF type:complete len:284 (+),score=33.94 TRINITY_DN8598_c0_g1_i2:47-898(+)